MRLALRIILALGLSMASPITYHLSPLTSFAWAAIPWLINYQGRLTDTSGKAVSGAFTITFRLYDASSSGTELWKEQQSITLSSTDNGIFSVVLGSSTVLTSVDFNTPMWISVQVGSDSEMTPRQRLTATGYALNADQIDSLDSTKFVRTDIDSSSSGKLTLTKAGAALLIKPSSDPSSSTAMIDLQNSSGTSKFTVDAAGNTTLNAQADLRLADADSSNYVAFQSPSTVSSNVTWTLPSADGSSNQVLSTDGSGTLSWATSSATGDVTDVGDCASGACFSSSGSGTALTLRNATSGTVTLQTVSGALGTKTVSLPSTTGTVAVAASSPLSLDSTTGTLTCSTCVTSTSGGTFAITLAGTSGSGQTISAGDTATIAAGSGISTTGAATDTVTVALAPLTADWSQTGAFDLTLNNASSELKILESAGATYYGIFDAGDLSADRTYTFPNETGTVCTSGSVCSGYQGVLTNSAGLAAALSNETGTGAAAFATSPTFTTSIVFNGTTSGTLTVAPPAVAGTTTITFPAETGTVCTSGSVCSGYQATGSYLTASSTATLTNKTYDTAGTGNVFSISGTQISAVTGTGSAVLATAPTFATSLTTPAMISTNADPADAGLIRLGNAETIAWEANPTGTDLTLTMDANNVLTSSVPINATTGFRVGNAATSGNVLRGNGTNFVSAQLALTDLATFSSANLATQLTDETGTGSAVLATAPTFATSLTTPVVISAAADPADAGAIRLGNAELIEWEASPAGTDVTLTVDASEILQASGAFNAGGAITGSNLSGTNTGDQTITLTGDVTGSGTGSFAATVAANSVALTTDTTGNYAAGDAEAGNALTGDSATSFFSTGALEVGIGGTGAAPGADDQALISDSTTAATWRTLPNCTDASGNHLNYTAATNAWSCGTTSSASTPRWDQLTAPSAATSFTSDATTETYTLDFQAAFTSGPQLFVKQSTGNPSGGNVMEVETADTDAVPLRIDNASTGTVADGLIFDTSGVGGVFTDAIDCTDAGLTNCINLGTTSDITASDGGSRIDLSAINNSATTEGLLLPQGTAPTGGTAEGQIGWDTNSDALVVGTGSEVAQVHMRSPTLMYYLYEEFFGFTVSSGDIGQSGWTLNATGAGAALNTQNTTTAGRPGTVQFTTGSTASGVVEINLSRSSIIVEGDLVVEAAISITTLADATDDYVIRFGLGDAQSADYTDGIYFEYNRATSANWIINAAAAGTRTKTTTSTAVATGWQRFKMVVNTAASSVEYFIGGTSVGTITTNLPTGSTNLCGPGFHIVKTAGTNARSMEIDYFTLYNLLNTAR